MIISIPYLHFHHWFDHDVLVATFKSQGWIKFAPLTELIAKYLNESWAIHSSTYCSIFCHSATLWLCHTAVLPFCNCAILHAVLPFCNCAILPYPFYEEPLKLWAFLRAFFRVVNIFQSCEHFPELWAFFIRVVSIFQSCEHFSELWAFCRIVSIF